MAYVQSAARIFLGDIFRMRSDIKQASANDAAISPKPATTLNAMGMLNVHFTMPIPLKNSAVSGLIITLLNTNPNTVESTTAGINDSDV